MKSKKMKTIAQHQAEVAEAWGFTGWEHLVASSSKAAVIQYMEEVAWLQAQGGDKGAIRPNSSGGRPVN